MNLQSLPPKTRQDLIKRSAVVDNGTDIVVDSKRVCGTSLLADTRCGASSVGMILNDSGGFTSAI